jgi:hypothetical protein
MTADLRERVENGAESAAEARDVGLNGIEDGLVYVVVIAAEHLARFVRPQNRNAVGREIDEIESVCGHGGNGSVRDPTLQRLLDLVVGHSATSRGGGSGFTPGNFDGGEPSSVPNLGRSRAILPKEIHKGTRQNKIEERI